jgi:hypothetical protein
MPWIRIAIQSLALGIALLPAVACFSPGDVEIKFTRPLELNAKIRTDRAGLTTGQERAGNFTGPYRDGTDPANCMDTGGCEVVAPVTPALVDGPSLENMLQSSCLWVADPRPAGGISDVEAVTVNWEFVAEVQREGMHLTCDSPTRFGLCRMRHPVTGQPIAFQPLDEDFVACPGHEPGAVDTMLVHFGSSTSPLAFGIPESGGPVVIENDLFTATSPLVAEFVGRSGADPYRRCPGNAASPQAFSGGTTVPAPLNGGAGCRGTAAGSVSACAVGCSAFAPAGDNALQLRDTSTNTTRWLQPNLMSVRATGTIARAMLASGTTPGLRAWRTGVSSGTDRWHENFSPNLIVDSVRVFVPGPNDSTSTDDTAPSIATIANLGVPGITVRGSYRKPDTVKTFSFDCPGTLTANGYEFTLTSPMNGCIGEQADVAPQALTPTYAHTHLAVASFPLTDPLQWEVVLNNPGAPAVMIEFRLRAVSRALELTVSPAALDLGDLVIGDSASGWLELRNHGSTAVRITSATLSGPNPPDFRFRLVGAPAPVPLPVSIAMTPGTRVVEILEFGSMQVVTDRQAAVTVGPPHVRLVHPDLAGKSVAVYGNQLDYLGDIAFHRDAPRAVPYTFPPGSVPLDVLEAYTAAALPLLLGPSQALRIAVVAQPGAYGQRRAELRIEAHPVTNPNDRRSVIAQLVAEGDTGALPALWPQLANWGTVGASGAVRNLLLVNDGDRDLTRMRISFASNRFSLVPGNAATQTLPPGTSEMFTVRYTPRCQSLRQPVSDTLLIETSDGTLQAQLRATPGC